MLYVTTRDELTTYTSERAMRERRAPDGGLYIPYRVPRLSAEDLSALRQMEFFDRVLMIARRFLRLSDRLLDRAVRAVRLYDLGNRITVCQTFRGEDGLWIRA